MRYVTHYEEYPIYEPAEGGYYYEGNEVVESEKMSRRAAKRRMKELWEEAKKENLEMYGEEEPIGDPRENVYPWFRSADGNRIWKYGKYIGDGESYILERHFGSEKRGWVPYC